MATLEDLCGDLSAIECDEWSFVSRGLTVKCWTYRNRDAALCELPPVIAIHGGPSFCHNYMLPLQLLALHGHPVIFYDQAGCGESSFVSDPATEAPFLLTIDYYVEELELLVASYPGGALASFFVYGSSWGTIVAQEYAVKQPQPLLGMILDGALCDARFYIESQWRTRIATMPTYTQRLLRKLTDERAFASPEYKELEGHLSSHFTLRTVPRPLCFLDSLKKQNGIIYVAMQGESEFTIGGVLENWTITSRLHLVKAPTLVLVGEYDTMTTECSQLIVDNISTAVPLVEIKRASHCKLLEEPHACIQSTLAFLTTCCSSR